jgi:hypothetical protein
VQEKFGYTREKSTADFADEGRSSKKTQVRSAFLRANPRLRHPAYSLYVDAAPSNLR